MRHGVIYKIQPKSENSRTLSMYLDFKNVEEYSRCKETKLGIWNSPGEMHCCYQRHERKLFVITEFRISFLRILLTAAFSSWSECYPNSHFPVDLWSLRKQYISMTYP
ncbi:hypothetical protein C0J52_18568 [Blattella germanica]|nr:hypothetical protein C0J52_18568 [Blattella germanica]